MLKMNKVCVLNLGKTDHQLSGGLERGVDSLCLVLRAPDMSLVGLDPVHRGVVLAIKQEGGENPHISNHPQEAKIPTRFRQVRNVRVLLSFLCMCACVCGVSTRVCV